MNYRYLLFCILLGVTAPVQAQRIPIDSVNLADTASRHVVRLRDGQSMTGRITAITADSVRMRLNSGEVALGRNAILDVRIVSADRFRNGVYWFENPHATRLLFSSTAFPLDRGTGYYSNTWLVMHTFAGGVTDRFTLGGGLLWFPGIPLDETFYYLLPKYTVVNRERGKLAVGALVGLLPFGTDDRTSAGILYGVGTTGSRDSNFSVGLGWGYAGDEIATNPVVMVGGQVRISRRFSFISENWLFPVAGDTEGLYSYGLRFLGEGLSVDLAFVSSFGESTAIPWLGFAFKF